MPDRDVETIRDPIYFQYAKIIARSAFRAADGAEAKRRHYGFVKQTFRKLKCGEISWSDILREDWQFMEIGKQLVEKKYLKTVLQCHVCAGTLDDAEPFRDGELSVLDIDSILR